MKKKKRSVFFTVMINVLFIAAIAAVGWKILDYVNDSRQTAELAEELWEQAAITAQPASAENAKKILPDEPEPAEKTENASIAVDTETGKKSEKTAAGIEPVTAETGPESTGQKPLKEKQTEVYTETYAIKNTPHPEEKKNDEKVHLVFLNMLNTTPIPAPTPRFTDMPDIPVGIDFDKLAKTNKDVAGWLYHPGIGVNLPVVQGPDNEYYLRRGFSGYHRQAGTLFIDYRNEGDFSDRNTIIYGHGRRDLTMFGKLHYYKKAEFCEKYPFFYLYVPGHRYRLEIVATGYTKDASDYYSLPAGDYWDELLDRLMEQSPYDFGIPISPEDHYVTLSTCAYDYQDERWIVIARIDDPDRTLP